MYGQVGSWDEGLSVTFDAKALAWLDAQGTERMISIVTEGRQVLVCPDDGVNSQPELRRKVANRGSGSHVDYRDGALFQWDIVQGFDLPRFSLFEVKWLFGNDGYYLYTELPADHLLPWPKLRECASYDMPKKIVEDLERRMKSAKAAYPDLKPAQWRWEPMPEKFRSMLAKGVYGDCLKAVIAGEDYAEAA
jgi:hypothetical protein